MDIYLKTIGLLLCSNLFMTFAWYSHLKIFHNKAIWMVILFSWSIAFFEYLFMVPANRIGFNSGVISLAQLKIIQEVITLSVFVPFAIFYMRQPVGWNFLGAAVCLVGAVFFIFRAG
jgi:uncharacterized protein (DUF486 family)